MRNCPMCSSVQIAVERRPDGNSICGQCHYSGKSSEFITPNPERQSSQPFTDLSFQKFENLEAQPQAADDSFDERAFQRWLSSKYVDQIGRHPALRSNPTESECARYGYSQGKARMQGEVEKRARQHAADIKIEVEKELKADNERLEKEKAELKSAIESWKRDEEINIEARKDLRQENEGLREKLADHVKFRRASIEDTDDGVRICYGNHDKNADCKWEHFRRPVSSDFNSLVNRVIGKLGAHHIMLNQSDQVNNESLELIEELKEALRRLEGK